MNKNILYQLLFQGLNFILPLLTVPYVSRVLGPDVIGEVSYANSLAYYFFIFGSLGLNLFGSREIAYNQGNKYANSRTLSAIVSLKLFFFIPLSIIYFFVFDSLLLRLTFLNILFLFFDVSWFFQGLERFKILFVRNLIVKLISVFLIFSLIKGPKDIYIYVLVLYGSFLIGTITLIPSFISEIRFDVFRDHFFSRKNFNYLILSLTIFVPQLAIDLYNIVDRTLIGYLIDNRNLGIYEMSQKIVRVFTILFTAIGAVMMPRVSSLFKSGENIEDTLNKSIFYAILTSLASIGFIFVSAEFMVLVLLGPLFIEAINLVKVLSFVLLPLSLGTIIGTQYILPTGMDREYKYPVLIGLVVNGALNLFLIPRFYTIGAAIASVVAEFGVLLSMMYITRMKLKHRDTFFSYIGLFYSFIIAFSIVLFLMYVFPVNNFGYLLFGVFFLILYIIISFYLNRPFRSLSERLMSLFF